MNTSFHRPQTESPSDSLITVAMMVMPSATAMGAKLSGEFQVPNCTGIFTSSVNHRALQDHGVRA